MTWKDAWTRNAKGLFIVLFLLSITLVAIFYVLSFVETRKGVQLSDPFLSLLSAVDTSVLLFFLTYSGTILGVIICLKTPEQTVTALLTYMVLLWLRMICMILTPLEPPAGIIPLRDYFLEFTFYAGQVNLKDLFFSGHTATMVMFFFLMHNKRWKYIFLFYSIAIAFLLLLQHAHYTIDVLVAPLASWTAFSIGKKMIKFFIK